MLRHYCSVPFQLLFRTVEACVTWNLVVTSRETMSSPSQVLEPICSFVGNIIITTLYAGIGSNHPVPDSVLPDVILAGRRPHL